MIKNGVLLLQPFMTLTVDPAGERGLLGIAFDPFDIRFAPTVYRFHQFRATVEYVASPWKHTKMRFPSMLWPEAFDPLKPY